MLWRSRKRRVIPVLWRHWSEWRRRVGGNLCYRHLGHLSHLCHLGHLPRRVLWPSRPDHQRRLTGAPRRALRRALHRRLLETAPRMRRIRSESRQSSRGPTKGSRGAQGTAMEVTTPTACQTTCGCGSSTRIPASHTFSTSARRPCHGNRLDRHRGREGVFLRVDARELGPSKKYEDYPSLFCFCLDLWGFNSMYRYKLVTS